MNPLVTLLTPAYNALPYLDSFLESVLAQTYAPLEFIIINDGSLDDTPAHLYRYAPLFEEKGISYRVLSLERTQGQAHAFNELLPLARGEFLTWCDADDLLMPDSIRKKAEYLMAHPSIGIVRTEVDVFNTATQTVERTLKNPAQDGDSKDIFKQIFDETEYCFAGTYMVRAGVLFDAYPDRQIPESREGQNLQLLLPPASASPCGFINESLAVYRIHADSHSNKKRSLTECLARNNNFYLLRLQILEHCSCDRDYYRKYAEELKQQGTHSIFYSAVKQARGNLGR